MDGGFPFCGGGNAFHKSMGVTMATLQKGWAGAGHSGEHSVIVYLRVFSTWCLFVVFLFKLCNELTASPASSRLHPV